MSGNFSVIIACGHSTDLLQTALGALGEVDTDGPFQTIVVDDGAHAGREEIVRAMASADLPVLYLRLPGAGMAEQWNVAIRESTGAFLAFMDDDCIPPRGWLRAYEAAFRDQAAGIIGGPDRVPPSATVFDRCLDYVLTSFVGTFGVRNGPNRFSRYYPRPWNMAVRKEAVLSAGGFDEDACEAPEVAMISRLEGMGYKAAYAPDALIRHRRETTFPRFVTKDFRLGMQRGHGASPPGLNRLYAGAFSMLLGMAVLSIGMRTSAMQLLTAAAVAYLTVLVLSGVHAVSAARTPAAVVSVPVLLAMHHAAHIAGFAYGRASRLWIKR